MTEDSLNSEIEEVKADKEFMNRLKQLIERDKEILDELAK